VLERCSLEAPEAAASRSASGRPNSPDTSVLPPGAPTASPSHESTLIAGIQVDHVTVYRWVQRFTPLFADAARPLRHATGDRWFVDETYVKVAGRWRYLYRAVDQYGQVIDVLLSEQRDTAAARRFFIRALSYGSTPVEVTTDKAGPYLRCWTNSSQPQPTSPSSTATTASKRITPGCARCAH
jgi:transposase-like protein